MRTFTKTIKFNGKTETILLKKNKPVLISVLNNEEFLLPHFIKHYKKIGIESFIFIDNDSKDNSNALLKGQTNTIVFNTKDSYKKSNFGLNWIKEILTQLPEIWILNVDIDEHFIYPDFEELTIQSFIQDLENEGTTSVFSPLIDLYPDLNLHDLNRNFSDFKITFKYFDRIKVPHPNTKLYYPFSIRGGVRQRVLGVPNCLNKYSLFKNIKGINIHIGNHFIDGTFPASRTCAILHYKLAKDFKQQARKESLREEHYFNAKEYKKYQKSIRNSHQEIPLKIQSSLSFSTFNQLISSIEIKPQIQRDKTLPPEVRTPIILDSFNIEEIENTLQFTNLLKEKIGKLDSKIYYFTDNQSSFLAKFFSNHFKNTVVIPLKDAIKTIRDFDRNCKNLVFCITPIAKKSGVLYPFEVLAEELQEFCPKVNIILDASELINQHPIYHYNLFQIILGFNNRLSSPYFISDKNKSGKTSRHKELNKKDLAYLTQKAKIASAIRSTLNENNFNVFDSSRPSNSMTRFMIKTDVKNENHNLILFKDEDSITITHWEINFSNFIPQFKSLFSCLGFNNPTFESFNRLLRSQGYLDA